MKTLFVCALGLLLITTGCQMFSKNTPPPATPAGAETRNNAYSLLNDLLGDEKDVSKVLIVKHNSKELGEFIKAVSAAAKKAHEDLGEFAKQDASLVLSATNLPPGEVATRNAIAKTKEKDLLTSSDDNFERALLLTQAEALNYAAHLAQVAADTDTNPQRGTWARALSRQMKDMYTQCVGLLRRGPHGD